MNIEMLRKMIDEIDDQILKLICERAVNAIKIGKEKNKNNLDFIEHIL